MKMQYYPQLIEFLQDKLAVPPEAIALVMRNAEAMPEQLPIRLWQYGLITLHQLDQIFDWQVDMSENCP